MRKKISAVFFVLLLVFIANWSIGIAAETEMKYINTEPTSEGVLNVKYNDEDATKLKLMIFKGEERYIYDLDNSDEYESFPLQMGNGSYGVYILDNIGGNKYVPVQYKQFNVQMEEKNSVYLNSVQMIKWNSYDNAIIKTEEIAGNLKSDREKIRAIYRYIVHNYYYDYDKKAGLSYNYLPDIDKIMDESSGICYDFSSLFASMLRSQGIPAKLVKGYIDSINGYHAWNEVYFSDTGEWEVIDTTYDIVMYRNGDSYSMSKEKEGYDKKLVY